MLATMALEAAPYWAKAIVQSGSEISCASKRYIDYFDVPAQVEGRHVAEAIDSLQKITGDATLPHGPFSTFCSDLSGLQCIALDRLDD